MKLPFNLGEIGKVRVRSKRETVNLKESTTADSANRWWEQDETHIAGAVASSYNIILNERIGKFIYWSEYLSAYLNRRVGSLDEYLFLPVTRNTPFIDPGFYRENVLGAAIDAYVAKASANKPRPVAISIDGDHALIKKAERLTLGMEGVFDEQKFYSKLRPTILDSSLFDFGVMFFYPDPIENKVVIERAWPADIGVGWADGRYGHPRNMIRHRIVSKGALVAMAKARKWKVEAAEQASLRQSLTTYSSTDNPVSLYEAWHLPSNKESKDGRHVICTSGGVLGKVEEWTLDRFPCAILKFSDSPAGFGGIGAAEQCISMQRNLDYINAKIRDWVAKAATRLFIEEGSNVSLQAFTDEEGSFVKYKGTPPQWQQDPGPSAAILNERERCRQAIFSRLGVSQMFAEASMPPGLKSAPAQQEYKQTMSERFMSQEALLDEFVIDAAELTIWCAEQLDGFYTTYRDEKNKILKQVKWKEISMPKDAYQVQIKVSGMLPRDPAGRLEKITEIGQQSPEAAQLLMRFMNDPDTDAVFDILNAGTNAVLYDMEQIEAGQQVIPDTFYDLRTLNTAQYLGTATYCKLRANEKTPVEVMRNLETYLNVVIGNKQKAMQAAQPMPAAPGGLPAVPMANAPMGPGGPMPPGMPGPGMPPPQGPMQ
jgi:hypothetical protein